jgi:hypothetical protein
MRRQANLRKQGKKNMKCHNFLWIVLLILPTAMIFLFWEFQRNKEAELGTLMKSESKTTLDKFSFTPISSTSGVNEKIIDSHEQEFGNVSIDTLIQDNPPQRSKNAYVTLIAGIDTNFKYRGFLYNAIIMRRALNKSGSKADFIAMLGFSDVEYSSYISDVNLLKSHGIIVHVLPRLIHDSHPLNFAEMALLKITPFNFIQYRRIQFFDGDVMPTKNMDCFFGLSTNIFTVGMVSPLNSGWFLGIPDKNAYEYMKERAIWRLTRDWDKIKGWKEPIPEGITYRGGKPVKQWEFNGASMDQGLFTHYFVINHGNTVLIDTAKKESKKYDKGLLEEAPTIRSMKKTMGSCTEVSPMAYYAHFTGKSKPWLCDKKKPPRSSGARAVWLAHLDALKLPINSKNISKLVLSSPLGYFNARFPKGGYKQS